MSEEKLTTPTLSYSSWSEMGNCEMRYAHRKVYNTPVDNDDEDRTAFDVGSATHHCVEATNWGKTKLLQSTVNEAVIEYPDAAPHKGLVHAMALKLIEQQQMSGLECIKAEQSIQTENFLGYIDMIAKDWKGDWYIIDLKTSSQKITEDKVALLPMDRQLNLYASFAKDLCGFFDLDYSKFKGCIYRVVVKSKAVQKAGEVYDTFVKRVFKLTQVYDVIIPIELMDIDNIQSEFNEAYERSLQIHAGEVPKKNFGACYSFYKLCPYFSRCHGGEKEAILKNLKIMSYKDYEVEEAKLGEL